MPHMALSKEERYKRHREYQNLPVQKAKRIVYDKIRQSKPEIKERQKILRNIPENKTKQKIANAKYRAKEEYKQYRRDYKNTQKAKESRRNQLLKKNFGINLETYKLMLSEQNNVCAICLKSEEKRSLAVDHCHKTGKIRGLLCSFCNQSIGMMSDNVENIIRAAEYLKKYV